MEASRYAAAAQNQKWVQWSIKKAVTPQPNLTVFSSLLPLSFSSVSHSSHTALSPFVHAPRMKTVPGCWVSTDFAYQKMWLTLWKVWTFATDSPSLSPAPVAPRALLSPAGMVEITGTAGILDHPDYSNPLTIINSPSRQEVFHLQPCGKFSRFPASTPVVVSHLDVKQSISKILEFLLTTSCSECLGCIINVTDKPHNLPLRVKRSFPPMMRVFRRRKNVGVQMTCRPWLWFPQWVVWSQRGCGSESQQQEMAPGPNLHSARRKKCRLSTPMASTTW